MLGEYALSKEKGVNQLLFSSIAYASAEAGSNVVFEVFGLQITSEITTMWGVMLVLAIVAFVGTRNLKPVPSGLQNLLEYAVETLENFLADLMGKKRARQYLPFLMTFFLLILVSNYSGLLPLAGHATGLKPPTSDVSVTGALAFIVFCSVIFFGIKEKGMGYFKHFIEPIPILLPINLLEQFTRPLSLALRLYGNVYGEEMVVASLAALIPLLLPLPIQMLGILFGAIQAFVFTLLAAMYIEEATAHH